VSVEMLSLSLGHYPDYLLYSAAGTNF